MTAKQLGDLPAFPLGPIIEVDPFDRGMQERAVKRMQGMTLRQHFAGLAMQGLARVSLGNWTIASGSAVLATAAVQCADALLVELAKEPSDAN